MLLFIAIPVFTAGLSIPLAILHYYMGWETDRNYTVDMY